MVIYTMHTFFRWVFTQIINNMEIIGYDRIGISVAIDIN